MLPANAQSSVLLARPVLVLSGFRSLPRDYCVSLQLGQSGLEGFGRKYTQSCADHTQPTRPSLWVWQEVDRKGPQELAGRSDSEKVGGHEGGRDIFL